MSDQLALTLPPSSAAPEMAATSLARIAGRRVIASVSGGKDSAALSLHLQELGVEHERVFMDTGWEHPATYDYLRGPLTDALGPITEIRGELDFLGLVERKGMFPNRVTRFCTTELKVFPIKRWLAARAEALGVDLINAVGIRRAESRARAATLEWEWSEGFDLEVWRPLVTWTADDVRRIHQRHGLEMNPLYELGASRVGCWPCIHARKAEIDLVARLDPARISAIREKELKLNERGAARDREKGRPFMPRTMFSYHGGDNRHFGISIDEAIEWAGSKRGEWQPPAAGESCMRWGLCETASEEASS
jgi:3'-phosphoadenosine 5'-phosphosulfate sulfotransferase (PAPS reductase)/FAD synthetase